MNVNQTVEMDFRMEVGQVADAVEVSALAAMLQTSDSQVGNLIETRTVVDLPLAARDFMQLSLISPGVSDSSGNSRHQTERGSWIGSFSVHGHDPTYNQYLFDGVAGKRRRTRPTSSRLPSMPFRKSRSKQQTTAPSSAAKPAATSMSLHGPAATRSTACFMNFCGTTRWMRGTASPTENQSCAEIRSAAPSAGPVLKDKTFYFVSWESMRLRQGFTQNTTVPDAKMKSGDFSALLGTDSSLRTPIVLYDWTTGQPFPGNIIPKDRQHPLPVNFINEFIPLPNRAGRGTLLPLDNYQSLDPQQTGNNQFVGRAGPQSRKQRQDLRPLHHLRHRHHRPAGLAGVQLSPGHARAAADGELDAHIRSVGH